MQERLKQVNLPNDQNSSGRTLGEEELELLRKVIESGTLSSTKGFAVKEFEKRFSELLGAKYAFACSSGTAAIHCAIAAINPEPGDEIITTSITDMGALTPILYQGAVPVFADVNPVTANITADSIQAALSERTRAIIVTHLFGNPCEMSKIMSLADEKGIPVIEDAAQAFLAKDDGKTVGTIGEIGCFSFQQGKHITAGEGGIIVTSSDDIARRIRLFIDKAWGYGDPNPDHYFSALNYRMTELQGAVLLGQLSKLKEVVLKRQTMAKILNNSLEDLSALTLPKPADDSEHAYWRYCPMIDTAQITDGPYALAEALRDYKIFTAPRYIQKPAFKCEVFRDKVTFGNSGYPFNLARQESINYADEKYPGTYKALEQILVMPFNERYQEEHIEYIAQSIWAQHELLVHK